MIPSFNQIAQSARILKQTSRDLINKNLVPEHALAYFKDKNMLKAASYNYAKEAIKSYGCPICGLTIKCPKAWIVQHIKIHEHNPLERKEGDIFESKLNPYFY
jgi:hypothetical protein